MTKDLYYNAPVCLACAIFIGIYSTQASAQDISLEELQGAVVSVTTNYRGTFARDQRSGPGNIMHSYRVKVGPDENVNMSVTRNVEAITPAGPKRSSLSRSFSGKIGTPGQTRAGNFLWLLDKNELVLLRTMDVGGFKLAIAFSKSDRGLTCKADAPYLKEAGARAGKTDSAFGGKVRIMSMQQVSAACSVSRP
jgi:hypothetical protein